MRSSEPHLLHVDSSARHASFSREVTAAFAETWREAHRGGVWTYRDLAADPVPHIEEALVEISVRLSERGIHELERVPEALETPAHEAAWGRARPLLSEVLAADVLLIGTPMYNFSIPSALKAWMDHVTFPGILSLAGKAVVVAAARGGGYGPGSPREEYDFQERYLRSWSKALGQENPTLILSEFTLATTVPRLAEFGDRHRASHAAAVAAARETAAALARAA